MTETWRERVPYKVTGSNGVLQLIIEDSLTLNPGDTLEIPISVLIENFFPQIALALQQHEEKQHGN